MPDLQPSSSDRSQLEQAASFRRRASKGAFLIGMRTFAMRMIGFAGSIVLAHLLAPRSFGIVALGYVLILAAATLTDGGLGAALVRGPTPPERADLAAVTGFQLAGTLIMVAIAGGVAVLVGGDAQITFVMLCSLPVITLQTPAQIMLERNLDYRPMIYADLSQIIVYNVWAIVTVAAFGAGVWGLATASIVSALVNTVVLFVLSTLPFVLPTLEVNRVRSIWAFGVRFQLIDITGLVRDQGLNTVTGALGGLGTLGLWSLTYRLLQPGLLVFSALNRVSFPGMARLRELGQDTSGLVVRSLSMTCVAASFVLAPLAASARALVPAVFGARWAPCADTLTMATWSLLLSGPLSVAASGYLLARGSADEALRIVIAHSIVGVVATAILVPLVGIDALGYAYIGMAVSDIVMFGGALRRHVPGFDPVRGYVRPILVSTAATGIGWLATNALGRSLLDAAVGALVALTAVFVGHSLTDSETLVTLRRTATSAVRPAAAHA